MKWWEKWPRRSLQTCHLFCLWRFQSFVKAGYDLSSQREKKEADISRHTAGAALCREGSDIYLCGSVWCPVNKLRSREELTNAGRVFTRVSAVVLLADDAASLVLCLFLSGFGIVIVKCGTWWTDSNWSLVSWFLHHCSGLCKAAADFSVAFWF